MELVIEMAIPRPGVFCIGFRSPDLSMDFRSVDNGFKQLHEQISMQE